MRGRIFSASSAAAVVIVVSLAASASAATVAYVSSDVPKTVDDGQTATSSVTVPAGRTPATDVNVVGFNLSSPSASSDRTLTLRAPNGGTAGIVGGCNTISDTGVTVDDEAPTAFSCAPASDSTIRPAGPPLSALAGAASGTWTMTFSDPGSVLAAGPGSLSSWALRITHAPFEFIVGAKGQELRPKVKVRATCNAKCSIKSSGDVKARKLKLAQNVSSKLTLPLKPEAFARLAAGGGVARFTLLAKDGYGDRFTQKVKIRFPG
jgi:hypothetical protein